MRQHEIRPQRGSRKLPRRLGRGTSQGQGKTAGRGTKGQLSRTGPGLPGWFEGGQTPLHMRVPKLRGFKNRFRASFVAVNVAQLATTRPRERSLRTRSPRRDWSRRTRG